MKNRVLFVCLGNICRSPLAEALFNDKINKAGLQDKYLVDSAGTGDYHVGEMADARTRKNAASHGIEITHLARQFKSADFNDFDFIYAMDNSNKQHIMAMAKSDSSRKKVKLMRCLDSDNNPDVPDPWFGGEEGFEAVYNILDNCTALILKELENN